MRRIDISAVSARISVHPSGEKGEEPQLESTASLELTGTIDEPIREVRDVLITLYSTERATVGTDPLPWIGLIHGFRPVIRPTVFITEAVFDRIWVLAGSQMLKHAYLVVTKPHYQSAYVAQLSVSTDPEE